ncbi:sodium:solute symporter family protein [Teredinibacter purpureus]|uniref:sodium:solute symporter family protein n=1 Tax=Teredinibacter purpureus TaxID=2731756 RepID=UPI0005F83335|nr:sodium:solute symporter family protein [Teredinibacter purpureus]
MELHLIDSAIVIGYLVVMIAAGSIVSSKASKNLNTYFLGGNKIPWYALSLSNAGGMFDIAGTMWLVYLAFVYGMKSAFIPWLWPFFNQIFMMIYLAVWLRRSNAMTGAEWIATRFDQASSGGKMAHMVVVLFSTISIVGFLAYGFVGIGKFAEIFLPWGWHPHAYATLITLVTAVYVVQGGLMGVVLTDIIQYVLMTVSAIIIAVIAMNKVSPEMLAAVTPDGWGQMQFGWHLGLDWSGILESVNTKIESDGWELFTIFIMMALFKGLWVSMAGPVPTQSLQRILAAKSPREAALMSGASSVIVAIPRYLMIGGLTVLALVFFSGELNEMGPDIDFELILPFAISKFIPVGLMGLLLAGMLSAHMSTTSSFLNVTPAYIVNDVYKKYFRPNASQKTYIRMSYLVSAILAIASIFVGMVIESVDSITRWIVSALWGGYAAANVLKWHWWRFNGHGYFWGMIAGLLFALLMPIFSPDTKALYAYPAILFCSLAGCIVGTLLTPAEPKALLMSFYSSVRPWGFWKPVERWVKAEDPAFTPNQNFLRDMGNVTVGIVWQLSIMAAPLALVIKNWSTLIVLLVVASVGTVILKYSWYDKLENQ